MLDLVMTVPLKDYNLYRKGPSLRIIQLKSLLRPLLDFCFIINVSSEWGLNWEESWGYEISV
jgi:hypothetical protein